MKHLFIYFCLLISSFTIISAQEEVTEVKEVQEVQKVKEVKKVKSVQKVQGVKSSLDHGSIQSQFDYLLKVSTTYQEYKVVKITSFNKFKGNISDSLSVAYKSISEANKEITSQKSSINNFQTEVGQLKRDLDKVNKEKDSIALLGMPMSKNGYKSLMWSVIFILIVLAVGAFLLFKRSNSVTRSTKSELDELQEEFEQHRKRTLKREQELAVKYHNEINKLKQNQA